MSKHTPEPWYRDDNALGGTEKAVCADGCVVVQTCTNRSSRDASAQAAEQDANLFRIVACVNALAGIADPAAFVEAAKAVVEAGKSEVYWIDRVDDAIAALARAAEVKP